MQTDSKIWTIYFDTCCLNRPFDEQMQPRIRRETQAISRILDHIRAGYWVWLCSSVLLAEIEQNPDPEQRSEVLDSLTIAHRIVSVGSSEILRGKQLEALGFKELDALHIACAESAGADIFLTTDDRLLGRAKRNISHLYVQIENPYIWLRRRRDENEYIGNDR